MTARTLRALALTSLAATAALAAPTARALPPTQLTLGAGLGFGDSAAVGSATGVTPELGLAVSLDADMALVVDWGLTWVTTEATGGLDKTGLALENPFIGLALSSYSDGMWLSFHPGVTLPLASITDDASALPAQTVAFNMARGARGMRDLWRDLPENASLVANVAVGSTLSDSIGWHAWLDGAFAFPTSDKDPDSDLIVELGLGVTMDPLFADLSLVWIPTNSGDNAQAALRAGLHMPVGSGAQLELAADLNLDSPFDSFGSSGVLGVEARLGFSFGGGSDDDPPTPPTPIDPTPDDPTPAPDDPTPAQPTPDANAFAASLRRIVEAFPGDFESIKGDEAEADEALMGTSWASTECLPGASECTLYEGMLDESPNFYAVMLETTDEAAATRLYESLTAAVSAAALPFTKVKLDDQRLSSLWSQGFIPFGASSDYEHLAISIERTTNPVMKVGDSYQTGWSIILRVEHNE